MMWIKKIIPGIVALLAWLVAWNCVAQEHDAKPEKYRVVNLNMKQGLPPAIYSSIIKDAFGFVWIGGKGLFRFDGTSSEKIIPDKVKAGAINSDAIYGFVEDSLNNIWMGTRMGLSRYDIHGHKFINFNADIDSIMAPVVSRDGAIVPFWTTATHVYCFEAHSQRIMTYDIRSFEKKIVFEAHDPNRLKIDGISIRSICLESETNSIWMLHNDPQSVQGILRISLDDGKTKLYTWPCLGNKSAHRHNAEAMVMDSTRKSIWINSGDGLIEFSLITKQFSHINEFSELRALPAYDRYVGIDIDRDGNIIMATQPKGIFVYDPIRNKLKAIMSDPSRQQRLGQNNMKIYCDRDGIVWVADYLGNGVAELLPLNPTVRRYVANPEIKDSLSNGQIYNVVNGAQGKVWIGTADGLNIFDPRTEKFEVLRERDLTGIKGEVIVPLYVDTLRQKAWLTVGSNDPAKFYKQDVYELDIKTKKCTPIIYRNGSTLLDQTFVHATYANPYSSGLIVYNQKVNGFFEVFPGKPFADIIISLKTPYKISEIELEDDKFIFLRSYDALPNQSFEMKNGQWTKIPHVLDTLPWLAMVYNPDDKTHWMSFQNELALYDKDFQLIKTYASGDINIGDVIEMLLDLKGNLWFINQLGYVGHVDKTTGEITYLSESDGYRNRNFGFSTPLTKDARGYIYLGTGYFKGSDGLDVININAYSPSPPPLIYLRSFSVNQQAYSFSEGIEVSLSHDQNSLVIEALVIDPYSIGNSKMRHRLEKNGNADDWEVGGTNHTIQYSELLPGKYKLVIQASNGGTNFNTEKIISITINPPYWESWWFRTLSILAVIGVTYSIVQNRSRSLLARERLKSDLRIAQVQQEKEHFELEKAKEIDKVKSTFFANISHEFRTPLTLIKGPVQQTLEESNDNPKLQERMKLVLRNTDLVLKLINQLLDLAKLESGTLTVEKSSNDINSFISAVVHSFSSLALQKNITLTITLPEISCLARFDKDKLETVLINLVNNAIKFTRAGGSVHVETCFENENKLVVTITDTGIGIPLDQQAKIFERFHQVSEMHEEVGAGIGLALVKELVSLMDGSISLTSQPGKGSMFIVTLPVEQLGISKTESIKIAEQESFNGRPAILAEEDHVNGFDQGPDVLVVEDNDDLRKFIIESLGKDFHFHEASDGKLGMEMAFEVVPDVIISDVMMPEMDGITMTRKIKNDTRTSHIPLILLTAKTTDESKLAGLGTGADDYLTKPFNKNELLLKVRNSIALRAKLGEKLKLELLQDSPKAEVQSADEQFLYKVREEILSRLSDEGLSVESLAEEMALSRSQLLRKITALTGMSVNELIRTFRLQKAAQLLEQNWGPVTQVAYEVGISNLSYFSRTFKDKYGVLPSEYPIKTN